MQLYIQSGIRLYKADHFDYVYKLVSALLWNTDIVA